MSDKLSALKLRLANLFKQAEPLPSGVSWDKDLRWRASRLMPQLGWPGILAIGLLVMCIPFYVSTIRPLQTSLEELQASLASSIQLSLHPRAIDHSLDTPAEQLVEFYKFFPIEKSSPQWLDLMVEVASDRGLTLNHGEYAIARDSVGNLRRLVITLPVQGTYPQIRQYLAELIAQIPNMSLEGVQFERKDIEDSGLQAKIRLVLYLSRES